MYISEIRLKNFKKFGNARFNFDHGINVIKGANEQGKSTLLKAIISALYIDPSSNKYRELYKSWNESSYPFIELDFFIDQNLYVIAKDFNSREATLRDVLNQTEEKNYVVIANRIKEYTGIGNESLLKTTACIHHDELAMLESGKKSIDEALQELALNEGSVNILSLLRELETTIETMQVGLYHPAKNNGIIKRLQNDIQERETDLVKLKTKEDNLGNSTDKLQSLTEELKQVDEQIQKYAKTVANFEEREVFQKEFDSINERIKTISVDKNKIEELSAKIKDQEAKFNQMGGESMLTLFDSHFQELLEVNKQIQEKQDELLHAPQQIEEVEIEEKNSLGAVYTSVGIIAFGLVLFGIVFNKLFIILGLVLVVINLGIMLLSHDKSQKEFDTLPPLPNVKQAELDVLKNRQREILQLCGIASTDDFFSKRTVLIALNSDCTQMRETISALLRGREQEHFEETLQQDIQRKTELESKLGILQAVTKDEYTRDKRELELLNLDKKDIVNELAEERGKVKVADVTPEEVKEKEEKLLSLKKQLQDLTHHLEVLQMIYESLKKAKDEISTDISKEMEVYVQKSLPELTNGKYDALRMDANFNIEVFSKEKQDWIKPHGNLSKGTIDQIFLSARLALVDIITKGKSIPLFFDDPFVTFDEKRRSGLMEELGKIAEKQQLFIFTCHDFFDSFGKVVTIQED